MVRYHSSTLHSGMIDVALDGDFVSRIAKEGKIIMSGLSGQFRIAFHFGAFKIYP